MDGPPPGASVDQRCPLLLSQVGLVGLFERRWMSTDGSRPKALVYLCHGFAEHCGYFHQVAECLASAAFIVVGLDYFGHGQSEGNVNHLKSFDTFVDHTAAHLAMLRAEFPDLVFHSIGYSMGALVLHRLTARNSQLLRGGGMIWLSPALQPVGMKLTKRRVQVCKRLMQYLPNVPLPGGKFLPTDLTRSRETQVQMSSDANIKQRSLYSRFCSLMLDAMVQVSPEAVCQPMLIAVGTGDKIAEPSRTAAFVASAQSLGKPVASREFAGGMHQLHTDLPAVGVALHQELLQWLLPLTP